MLVHFGRPKGQVVESMRVGVIGERLAALLGAPVSTLRESVGPDVERAVAEAPAGTVILCENVRFHPARRGDPELGAAFARLGDVFVGDAFGAAHRDHASVSGARAPAALSAAGLLLEAECRAFAKVLGARAASRRDPRRRRRATSSR